MTSAEPKLLHWHCVVVQLAGNVGLQSYACEFTVLLPGVPSPSEGFLMHPHKAEIPRLNVNL